MKQIKPLMQREKPAYRQFRDIEGEIFGRLTVISYAGCRYTSGNNVIHYWNCACECGSRCVTGHKVLISNATVSCGCYQRLMSSASSVKHGMSGTQEYKTYFSMKSLCLDTKHGSYKKYGGRGISICDRWLYSFENFLADMGARPRGKSLGRIDQNGNYDPGNCRWMTKSEIGLGGRKMPAREEAA